jgi:hypothetical protein
MNDLKLLKMILDQDFMKFETKEKRLVGIVNMFDIDLKDHRQDHQLLLELNGSIWEAVVLV